MPARSQRPFGSANATLTIAAPDAIFGSSSFCVTASAQVRSACAANTDVPRIRRAEQGAPHLFHRDQELDRAVAGAAVLLGNDQPDQAELLGELLPDLGVVAALA